VVARTPSKSRVAFPVSKGCIPVTYADSSTTSGCFDACRKRSKDGAPRPSNFITLSVGGPWCGREYDSRSLLFWTIASSSCSGAKVGRALCRRFGRWLVCSFPQAAPRPQAGDSVSFDASTDRMLRKSRTIRLNCSGASMFTMCPTSGIMTLRACLISAMS